MLGEVGVTGEDQNRRGSMIRCQRLSDAEQADVREQRCPDCMGTLREGPHGGLAVNWICNRCARVFNDMGPFGVERIVETSDRIPTP
jgi:ribosomal protein L37AE/L43A